MGYLPLDRTLWAHELEKKQTQYYTLMDELLRNPVSFSRVLVQVLILDSIVYLLGPCEPTRLQLTSTRIAFFFFFRLFQYVLVLLKYSVASQSEITRRMEDSAGSKNEELSCLSTGLLSRSKIIHGEHPLSLMKSSVWNQYFQVLFFKSKWESC